MSSSRGSGLREIGDDAIARLALGDDPSRGALQTLGVGDRGASELHDDGPAHGRVGG